MCGIAVDFTPEARNIGLKIEGLQEELGSMTNAIVLHDGTRYRMTAHGEFEELRMM